jgi:arylsulfatase A-like enzyme
MTSAHNSPHHSQTNTRRVLIIGADGLRPDLLDPTLMPVVSRLAAEGVQSPEHHAVYPTHTRVNISALTTGSHPGRHGIVANTMLAPGVRPDHIIDTGDYEHLQALEAASGGHALLTPSLGDLLAAQGARLAVAASSTPGAGMLWSHRHLSRMVNPASTYGIADLYDLREKLGEIPPRDQGAQIARQHYITSAVTEIYLDDPRNRVIVLWFNEPDSSQHYYGLGSPQAKQALQTVDVCVGEVLAALDQRGLRDQFDIFFVSDHGHTTVLAHNTLREYLQQAEREIGRTLPPLTTASDYLYARPGSPAPTAAELAPLVEWLYAQPWTGAVLGGRDDLAALPGVLPLTQVWRAPVQERWPLLAVSPRWSDALNEFGVPGAVQSLTTQSALRSSHGSASHYDLHAVLIAHGPSLHSGGRSPLPTGAIDLAPTVLTLLGMTPPAEMQGRVLWEIMAAPAGEPAEARDERVEPTTPAAGVQPALHLHHVGDSTYLHGALQEEVVPA